MWQKLVKALKPFVENALVKSVTSAILKALGIAGGFWTWIVGFFVGKAAKKVVKEAESAARVEDRENADEKRKEHHDKLIKENASEDELIESELDLLNGGRGRKP